MTPNLNADIHLSGADPDGYVVSLIPDTEVATVKAGRLTIFGGGAELFALATALLDAVNLCPPFPEPTCGDIDEDDRCTRAPGHAGSHGNGVAAWEHFPTRDGDDLADWIDPIVRGEVAS